MKNILLKTMVGVVLLTFLLPFPAILAASGTPPADYEEFSDTLHGMMEEPVDYEGLFALSDELDGAFSEGYYYEMNQLFIRDPGAFLNALSQQPYERISSFAFILAGEHMLDWDTYRTTLAQSGVGEEALFLMEMGILVVESNTKYSNPEYYEQTFLQQVKAHYQEDNRLFLLGIPDVGESFYFNVADALIAGLDDIQLQELRRELGEIGGLTESAGSFVAVAQQQIDSILNPDSPEASGEPDITETPEEPVVPQKETEPSVPTQKATVADSYEEKESSNFVWVIVAVAVVAIGAVAVVVTKKH